MGRRCLRTAYFLFGDVGVCLFLLVVCTMFDRHVSLTITEWMPVAMGIRLYGYCFDWLRYVTRPPYGVLS